MLMFMRSLMERLNHELPGWQEDTLVLLDGARYHTSPEMKQYLRQLGIQVIYTAPYCYTSSPIERLFAGLKFGELNPTRVPTGKR